MNHAANEANGYEGTSAFTYIKMVPEYLAAYEDFYANNGDFDNAAMLRHFATSIVAFEASDVDNAAFHYAVTDILDLLPTIKELVYENEKGEPQPLVLTEASPNQTTKFKESKQ